MASYPSPLTRFNNRFRPWIVWTLRLAVGATFMLSGFVKMIDVWGFVFKLEDYMAVWHISQPRSLVMVAAMLVSGFEFVLGAQLLTGSYKRSAPWLLTAMMAVMLPLTAYLWAADPIDDCGCFGDYFHLSNGATFLKNVVLTLALVYLSVNNRKVTWGFFKPAVQWVESLLFSLYILAVGLYGFNVQPMLDFRPFAAGTPLVGEEAEEADDALFVYDADSGEEATEDAIAADGRQLLLVITEPARADIAFTYAINEINDYAKTKGVKMAGLISAEKNAASRWVDLSMADYPVYTADDTRLKQLARGVMVLVMLKDGRVEWKRTVNSVSVDMVDRGIADDNLLDRLAIDSGRQLKKLTIVFLVLLAALCIFQGTVIAINYAIRTRIRRIKEQEKQAKEKDKGKAKDKVGSDNEKLSQNS